MDWRIIFFDDTLEERFLLSTESSLLLGDLLKNIEDDARSDNKYVKWWNPSKYSSTYNFSMKPAPIFCSFRFPWYICYTTVLDCTKNLWLIKDWHELFSVICCVLVFFPQGACIFLKGRDHVLQFCFFHIIYHRSEKVEDTS